MKFTTLLLLDILENFFLPFIKPTCCLIYSIHNLDDLKLLARLRLCFSYLREHKFRHNFHNTLNPLCSSSLEPETASHYLLHCHNFSFSCLSLMKVQLLMDSSISQLSETGHANILLYGDSKISISKNSQILQGTIKYIFSVKRFNKLLI